MSTTLAPGNWTPVRATDSGRDLGFALALELRALPVPIDFGMEPLGIAHRPDLLAYHQVIRIQVKRGLPFGKRLVALSHGFKQASVAQFGVDQLLLGRPEGIGRCPFGAGTRILAGEETLDDRNVLGLVDREAAVFRVANGAVGIDKDAIGNRLEVQETACQAVLVGDDRIGCAGGLDERASKIASAVLQRDADDFEVVIVMSLVESLPPGQLFTAASPGSPEEEQESLSPQVGYIQIAAVQ